MKVAAFSMIIVVSMIIDCYESYRILGLFSMPGKSHFQMFQALMKGLARKGHQVDVISSFPQKTPYPNYTDIIQLQNGEDFISTLTYDDVQSVTNDVVKFLAELGNEDCALLEHPEMLKLIREPPNDPPYDLLILEFYSAHCFMALGHHLKVPVIGASTAVLYPWLNSIVANPHNIAFVSNNFLDYNPPMNFWQRFHNTIQTIYDALYYRYLTNMQEAYIKKYFGPDAPGLREAEKSVSLVLVNSHVSVNGPRAMTSAVIEVGGLHVQDTNDVVPKDLKDWMDSSKDGFIYFTFGSMINIESFPVEIIKIFYKSFEKISPVRVLMKVPKPELLPPGLPKNIRTFVWAPQVKVLKHKNIKAFVTHGGLMGTQEAIYWGVPMIGMPLFIDQFTNVDLYTRKKMAVKVEYRTMTQADMDNALNEILYNPIYKNSMQKISSLFRDRPMSAMDTATWWVEYIARRGPEPLRSPAMDMPWWQIELLDVYAVLLLLAILTLYLSIIVARYLFIVLGRLLLTVVVELSRPKAEPKKKVK